MNRFEEAAEALETAADALEKIPDNLRYKSLIIGPLNSPTRMREEAKHLYEIAEATKDDA